MVRHLKTDLSKYYTIIYQQLTFSSDILNTNLPTPLSRLSTSQRRPASTAFPASGHEKSRPKAANWLMKVLVRELFSPLARWAAFLIVETPFHGAGRVDSPPVVGDEWIKLFVTIGPADICGGKMIQSDYLIAV